MRDMKDAPRDGTRIIVWSDYDKLPHCAHWNEVEQEWDMCDEHGENAREGYFTYIDDPIGWQPLILEDGANN